MSTTRSGVKHFREKSRKRVLKAHLEKTLNKPTRKRPASATRRATQRRDPEPPPSRLGFRKWLVILDAKTGDRIVPMNTVVKRALQLALPKLGEPNDLIFGGVDWIKDAWPTVCREAKIENLHFHDLRATYVTRILEAGYDNFTARDAAGHNIRTTGIYARTSIERVRKALNSLSDAAQIQLGKATGTNG